MSKTGNLSINSENIFPIIKKWLYSDHDIFVRELVSNGCDAITKLKKLEAMGQYTFPDNYKAKIEVICDPDAKTLKFIDNGLGMDEDELEKYITQIAFSGATDFLEKYKDKANNDEIIGHFGLGFYSAFMVADKVEVFSKAFGEDEAHVWTSSGTEGYDIAPCEKAERGTEIVLHIKKDTDDEKYSKFLEEYEIRSLVKKYSDYIRYPIRMEVTKYKELTEEERKEGKSAESYKEEETLNSMVPLWKKNKSELTKEDYDEFYKNNFYDYEAPLKYIHVSVEGAVSYKALLFIPAKVPYDYYSKNYEKGLKLYTDGVLITEKCADLLPDYFSFVKGLVDSELQLNISRETIQHNRQLQLIESNIEKKIKNELLDMQKNDRATYDEFFKNFGLQLKYGLYSGWGMNKDVLQDLIMFKSVKLGKYVTLKEYVDAFGAEQKYIYYGSAKTENAVKALPQSEKILDEGYDILCFTDDVDEFAVKMLGKYEEKEFKNILDESVGVSAEDDKKNEEDKELLDALKNALGDKVAKVKVSSVLKNHPVCLSSEGEVSIEMEKVLSQMPNAEPGMVKANKILEVNAEHPIYAKLKAAFEADKDSVADYAEVLYQSARLVAGLPVEDASGLTDKLFALLAK